MPVPVHRHLVTGVDDLARKRRPLHDLFPDEEEGRRRTAARKRFQHRRCSLGVRPVVEGQGDAVLRPEPPLDPIGVGQPRHVRCQRRGEPVGSHATSASTSDAADGNEPSARPGAGRERRAA